jgi:hypothetical protein
VVGAVSSFLTPSRNIGCLITDDQARCDIRQHTYRTPDKPDDCQGDYGLSIVVPDKDVALFVCVTDTVIDPRAPVLAYGTSTVVGHFGCTSRTTAIRCYDLKSGHGFWLSRETPSLF